MNLLRAAACVSLLAPGVVSAMQWAYVDASFGACKVPQTCGVTRVETQLHALSALGRDQIISRARPGAMAAELLDDALGLIADWESMGLQDAGADHLVWGFGNDFWDGSGERAIDALHTLAAEYAARSPRTAIWVLDYPPIEGAPGWVQDRLRAVDYEDFRARYRAAAAGLGLPVLTPYQHWQASGRWHPLLQGPDYHVSQHSAVDAALHIYSAIREWEQRRITGR